MTDDMEERLREVLRQRAEVPTAAGDPVDFVQDRMRRRSRRRGISVASTAALCVAGIAIAATALAGNGPAARPIGPAGTSSNPPVAPSPSATPQLTSAEATAPAVSLPASPMSPVTATTVPANVSSLTLLRGYDFGGLTSDSGQLLVTGSVPMPSTHVPPLCAAVSISGDPPAVHGVNTSHCDDPATSGEPVAMVVTEKTDAQSASGVSGTIAISHHNSTTNGYAIGPTVMKYTPASDTQPVAAYGGGSLWIYDVDTSDGPEAIQISATSGQVQDVVRTPALTRPIVAANSDGLWLGNSIEGGEAPGTVFHVAPGSHTVTTVLPSPNDAVDWMVAGNGHVWAGIRPAGGSLLSLWRFDGPTAKAAFDVPEPSLEVGPNFVVGDEQDGLWLTTPEPPFGDTPSPGDNQHLDVVKLDANTAKPTVEAILPPLDLNAAESQIAAGQAAFFAGNYFLLQSPSVGAYTGFAQLLRITPLP